MKSGAFTGHADSSDTTLMIFYDPFTHGEADAGTAVLIIAMKTLEDAEDLVRIFLVETDSVIADPDMKVLPFRMTGNRNDRWPVGHSVFQRIGKEIAEKLGHL